MPRTPIARVAAPRHPVPVDLAPVQHAAPPPTEKGQPVEPVRPGAGAVEPSAAEHQPAADVLVPTGWFPNLPTTGQDTQPPSATEHADEPSTEDGPREVSEDPRDPDRPYAEPSTEDESTEDGSMGDSGGHADNPAQGEAE